MLRRLIGENIDLVILPHENLWNIRIDPGQVEQVLTNLVVNARDAMPDGGTITIETGNETPEEEFRMKHPWLIPGDYVSLTVSDTGTGMDPETVSRIFEPFFTTKEQGKGTGLGLSTCYGIVKQNGGGILADSEPGRGTSIRIYLPRTDEEKEEALRELDRVPPDGFNLVMTDVIMPRMGGKELHDRIREKIPGMKVLFMSGYTDNSIVHHGILDTGPAFIQKPFKSDDLAKKVRRLLDG